MIKSKSIEFEGVGRILFERSKRAKYINISVRPLKGVRVAVPEGVPFSEARRVAQSKMAWIKKHLIRTGSIERENGLLLSNLKEIEESDARKRIIRRLKDLSEKHGFIYNRVFLRNQKTIWGSCSGKNNISLNLKIIGLPEQLMDYIILHELLHTKIKNHGKRFWDELNRLVGDAKGLDRSMKEYGVLLV